MQIGMDSKASNFPAIFRVTWWDQKLYPPGDKWESVNFFLKHLYQHISEQSVVLDVGAGAGTLNRYDLKGRVGRIVGVDLDPRVIANPLLDEGFCCPISELPFNDSSIDLAFSIYVLEHIQDPRSFCREIQRVLKPGGIFMAITPSRFHYVSLISRFTPLAVHNWVRKGHGVSRDDTFETYYRMNSRQQLRVAFCKECQFEEELFLAREFSPYYLRSLLPLYMLGIVYEKLVNSLSFLQSLRVNIVCAYRKRF